MLIYPVYDRSTVHRLSSACSQLYHTCARVPPDC